MMVVFGLYSVNPTTWLN